jgi:hypothetical protein
MRTPVLYSTFVEFNQGSIDTIQTGAGHNSHIKLAINHLEGSFSAGD